MADQSNYVSKSFLYQSRGLWAREAYDRCPPQTYIQFMNMLEREEEAVSSRYGVFLLTRDAVGSGNSNYFFSSPVQSLSRLTYTTAAVSYAFRYAGLADGALWRRGGSDGSGGSLQSPLAPGPYTQLTLPTATGGSSALSGQPFQSLVASCYASAQAYLFIADSSASLRDVGVGNPALWGIDPPPQTLNAVPYSPLLTRIDNFSASNSYVTSNFSTPWTAHPAFTTIPTASNSGNIVTDFPQFSVSNVSYEASGLNQANTLTAPSSITTYSAVATYPSAPVGAGETVSLTFLASWSQTLTGSVSGSGSIQYQYSVDGGFTWTTFFTFSGNGVQAASQTITTSITGISNLIALQVRVAVSTYFQSGSGSIATAGVAGTPITAVINTTGIFGAVCNGILSNLTSGSGNVPGTSSATVYATQYLTNIVYAPDYEFAVSQLRTVGSVGSGVLTNWVIATGFGFDIPATATITGIAITLNWLGQHAGTGILTNAGLVYGGAAYGVVKTPGTANASVSTSTVLGDNTYLWGTTPTPAIVNSPTFGFGVQITTQQVGSTDRSFLNWFSVTVSYTVPTSIGGGTLPVSALPIISIESTNLVHSLYQSLLVTCADSAAGSYPVAIYGTSNEVCDGFYQATQTASNTFTVPFKSPTYISATGGTLYYYPGGIPSDCILTNQYSTPYPTQMSAWGFYQQVPANISSFPIDKWEGAVSTNTTATIAATGTFDLSQNNQVTAFDLIVLTLKVGSPANISNIRLAFDINGSGYTSSYYYANIAPAYYQGNIADQQSAYQTTQNQIIADTLGLLTGQPVSSTTAQLQPSNFSTGSGAWTAVLIPRGNFLPVGQAGQSGLDWNNVTGWQLTIETTATAITGDGSSTVACNGLYLQWGYGPSSFGGTGYDYRFTYFNIATFTESSPSPEQQFSQQWGYLSSLAAPFYLRQAVQLTGQYSVDPQVTHLRVYRRGGLYASNWLLIDQVPNITGGGQFFYKDVIPDNSLAQAQPLALDNDPPVTSTLTQPLQTTLAAATTGPGSTIYSAYSPQLVTVMDAAAEFVVNQVVLIGNASNLEEVLVTAGGTGQFTAVLRLQHNAGEPVQVNSLPRVHCNLCAISNSGGVQVAWLAGDPNNPNYLYYSKASFPENFSPAARIPVSEADDPIQAVINWRGTIVVATLKTWYTVVGGAQPYAQPTGAAHGLIAQQAWTWVDGAIWFRASDGLRAFSGADGVYQTLPVEWLYRGNPALLPPAVSASNAASDIMAYFNNEVFNSYISTASDSAGNPLRYRLNYHCIYHRFRQDDLAATAMLWERDTNQLLLGIPVPGSDPANPAYTVAADQQYNLDYDDGGWAAAGTLTQQPIALTLQVPFNDLGKPHFPKQWNMLEGDYYTAGQDLHTTLLFYTEPQTALVLPIVNTGAVRDKVQFQIPATASNKAQGEQGYSMSVLHTMAVTTAPVFYQEDIYAMLLADYRTSWDTYWQGVGGDLLGILPKNGYFDYSATEQLTIQIFADGDNDTPYYADSVTLIPQADRAVVRVQFPARQGRLWRMVVTSAGKFQLWAPVRVETKMLQEGSGYREVPYPVYQ